MNHSIIIPHHDRRQYLDFCVKSIARSAVACGVDDYEIIVVEYRRAVPPRASIDCRRVALWPPETPFNKSRLLNLGLEHALGDFVSILDCDMLVGRKWMECSQVFRVRPTLTRLAYRVRQLTRQDTTNLFQERTDPEDFFLQYNNPGPFGPGDDQDGRFGLGWEAYGDPERNVIDRDTQPWGNSQFTMRRADLDGLWFDDRQAGKGWEDIDFNRQVQRRFGDDFRGMIVTNGEHGLLHMHHERIEDWDSGEIRQRNLQLYRERWEPK